MSNFFDEKEEREREEKSKAFYGKVLSSEDYQYLKNLDDEYLNKFDTHNPDDTGYTKEDYKKLYENIKLYKEGNREAAEYIVSSFHRILHAYACFIKFKQIPYMTCISKKTGEKIRVVNPSIRKFMSLYTTNNKTDFKNNADYIYELYKKYEFGDIYNELVLALLNMANKYKIITDPKDPKYKPNGTFHLYVYKCFHFEAFHFLTSISKDPLAGGFNILSIINTDEPKYDRDDIEHYDNIPQEYYGSIPLYKISVNEEKFRIYDAMIDCIDRQINLEKTNISIKESKNIDLTDDNSLNFNWINGSVCSDTFKCLTSYERELLVLSFVKNKTDTNIAELFHCSRQAIGVQKRKAIAKLEAYAKEHNNRQNQKGA